MATLEIPLAEELAETAHWSDDPPVPIEEQEFERAAQLRDRIRLLRRQYVC